MRFSLSATSLFLVTTLTMASFVNAVDSCTVGSLPGECVGTGSCSSAGGSSTPGLCPGPADIQCCTYGSCKNGSTAGKCQPTSSCTGTSTPGLCPGGANIQCCTPSSTPGGTCTVGSLPGECVGTGSCSSSGGTSTPGHCPGPTDIQCCTYGSCKNGSTAGKCQPTSTCTGTSTPGLCPGGANIQCCTPPSSPGGTCTVGSLPGECVGTGSCSSAGGTSTPGHCPGPADIQCCTYGTCKVGSTSGKCQPTSTCTGTSTPGHCPGASNIQCCTSGGSGGTCPPNVNSATVALVKEFEGFVPSPAPDPIGLPTVGYGHLCKTSGCSEVPFSFPLSESEAAQLMQSDMKTFTKCLNSYIRVALNANQFGALASWAFNVGCGNVQSSALVSRLNNGESPNTVAAAELPRWNRAGGQVLPGLTRRRAAEVKLFQTGSSAGAIPC